MKICSFDKIGCVHINQKTMIVSLFFAKVTVNMDTSNSGKSGVGCLDEIAGCEDLLHDEDTIVYPNHGEICGNTGN